MAVAPVLPLAATLTRLARLLLHVLLGVRIELLLAALTAEADLLPLVLAARCRLILVHLRATDWILDHGTPPALVRGIAAGRSA
jgi:hypothetical protein